MCYLEMLSTLPVANAKTSLVGRYYSRATQNHFVYTHDCKKYESQPWHEPLGKMQSESRKSKWCPGEIWWRKLKTILSLSLAEIARVQSGRNGGGCSGYRDPIKYVDVYRERPIRLTVRVLVPVREHPKVHFLSEQQLDSNYWGLWTTHSQLTFNEQTPLGESSARPS